MSSFTDSNENELQDGPVKPGAIRIILADSQAIFRVGIRKIFALEDDLRVVAQADTFDNLRSAIERYPTDVVLLEGSLLSGIPNAIPELLRLAPDVKLIVQAQALAQVEAARGADDAQQTRTVPGEPAVETPGHGDDECADTADDGTLVGEGKPAKCRDETGENGRDHDLDEILHEHDIPFGIFNINGSG